MRCTRARPPRALERLGEEDNLLAAAAAELDDRALGVAERRDDRAGVPREQLGLRRA